MNTSSPWWHRLMIPLVACAASGFLSIWLENTLGILEWRRPVQEWLRAYGLGAIAPYYAFVNLHIPDAILAATFGALLGLVGRERWVRFVLLYAIPYLLFPYFMLFATGSLKMVGGWGVVWRLGAYDVWAVVPFAVSAAWLGSRPRRRRKEHRRSAGLCPKCAYDLTANESGVCPECGTEIASPSPDSAL